jgi:hypothetical protein
LFNCLTFVFSNTSQKTHHKITPYVSRLESITDEVIGSLDEKKDNVAVFFRNPFAKTANQEIPNAKFNCSKLKWKCSFELSNKSKNIIHETDRKKNRAKFQL